MTASADIWAAGQMWRGPLARAFAHEAQDLFGRRTYARNAGSVGDVQDASFDLWRLEAAMAQQLGEALAAAFDDADFEPPVGLADAIESYIGPVSLGARRGGKLVLQEWAEARDGEAPVDTLRRLVDSMTAAASGESFETLELCVCDEGRELRPYTNQGDMNYLRANIHRAVRALRVEVLGEPDLITPMQVAARNRGFRVVLEEWSAAKGHNEARMKAARYHSYRPIQLLVPLDDPSRSQELQRCTTLVRPDEVTPETVEALARTLGDYLYRHVRESGQLTYKYEPSEGRDVEGLNNMIRQWMATCAMSRAARARPEGKERDEAFATTERNILHNLRNFYRAQGSLGIIEWDGQIKLGAIAIAVMSLMEHPTRANYARAERKLFNTIDELWQADGSFQTMLKPVNHTHGRNFYPGEALLALAMRLSEKGDEKLAQRFKRSFVYWRQWHRDNLNPAFIPWHTQAYYLEYRRTGDPDYRDFIFEMSDWLLSMQQVRSPQYADVAGRFFDPKRPKFGTPHSSSTGVYIEGLIDAWALAKEVGDTDRQETYRQALVRGLRNVMQLTYLHRDEAFYALEPDMALGGVRTSSFNSVVRCDNVQHNLMGILKLIERFSPEDYVHPPHPEA